MAPLPVLKALVDPVSGVPQAVEARRWVLPLLAVCAAVSFSGIAFALRLDAAPTVLKKMEESGDLAKASEREIGEQVEQAQRIALVAGAAKGVLLMPLELLFIAVALKVTAWLFGRKLLFAHAFTVATVAFLPVAIFHVVFGVVALKQSVLVVSQAATLLPSSLAAWAPQGAPNLGRVLGAIDFFNVWAAVLLGLGFAKGVQWSAPKGLAVGLFLYVMVAAVSVAAPGLAS